MDSTSARPGTISARRTAREGYLVYSVGPRGCTTCAPRRRSGVIAPDELRSVGLTNTPRLPDVPAWTNAAAAEEFSNINFRILKLSMNYKSPVTRTLRLGRRCHR